MPQTTNQKPDTTQVTDVFKRPLHDLRLSVIDRCNFRCPYCMPEETSDHKYIFLKEKDWLTFGEIVRIVKLFLSLGVGKVRVTGGEPLLRPALSTLIEQLNELKQIEDLALTTNGALLKEHAAALKKAGLKRLTVSLDSLDDRTFRTMNGKKAGVQQILSGIAAARQVGFEDIKINAVVQKGVNEETVMELVNYARTHGHILRFIEYMDVGNCNHWQNEKVVPSAQLLKMIGQHYPLATTEANYFGEVAERYLFADGKGEIGFISSVTQPFCGTCTRMRLSTDGKMYTCLFATQGTDIRTPLRDGASDLELLNIIRNVWQKRGDRYSENRYLFRSLKDDRKKVEMYQIGG